MLRVVMPTLVWVYRPKSGTIGAAAAVPDPVHVALPAAVSSKRCADAGGGKRKKRKEKSRAKAATTAKRDPRRQRRSETFLEVFGSCRLESLHPG